MSYERIPEHQAYFRDSDYDDALREYQYHKSAKDFPPEKLLIIAKALFISKRYPDAADLLIKIASSSPKIQYERLCLLFKVKFLLERDVTQLNLIIQEVTRTKLPPHLQNRVEAYRNLIKAYKSPKSVTSEQCRIQLKKFEKSSACEFQGFPCYLVSKNWHRQLESRRESVVILSNLQIINDLYQTAPMSSPEYLEFILFPDQRSLNVSKKHWQQLVTTFNGGWSLPIKRYLLPNPSYQKQAFYSLSPVVVEFKGQNYIFQLPSKASVQRELYPLLKNYFGIGNLWRKKVNILVDPDIRLGKLGGQVLRYELIQLSSKIDQKIITKLSCRFNLGKKQLDYGEGLLGLQNLGNSCYLGACLQCLSHTRQLSNFLRKEDLLKVANLDNRNCYITFSLADLFRQLWGSGEGSVVPQNFKKYFGIEHSSFRGKSQQDAHQFLLGLLNTVHDDLRRGNQSTSSMLQSTTDLKRVRDFFQRNEGKSKGSVVSDLLRGSIHGTIKCGACGNTSHSFDSFLALSLSMLFPETNPLKIYHFRPPFEPLAYEMHTHDLKKVSDVFDYFKKEVVKHGDKENTSIIMVLDSKRKVKKLFSDRDPKNSPIVPKKNDENSKGNSRAQNNFSGAKKQDEGKPKEDIAKESTLKKEKQLNGDSRIRKQQKPKEEQQKKAGSNISERWEINEDISDLRDGEVCFLEVSPRTSQNQSLTLIQIKRRGERIVFPILKYVQCSVLSKQDERDQKQKIRELLFETIRQSSIRDVEIQQHKDKLYEWVIKVDFKEDPRLWNEKADVYREINYPEMEFELEECLRQLKVSQKIEGWRCGKCKKISYAEKNEQLYQTGNIFIICLKRFKADSRKIRSLFKYPLEGLDLSSFLQSSVPTANAIYDLYAVCLHQGTAEYGHYRAYCKSQKKGQWFLFDDHLVRSVDPKQVVSSSAYILFYRRRQFII